MDARLTSGITDKNERGTTNIVNSMLISATRDDILIVDAEAKALAIAKLVLLDEEATGSMYHAKNFTALFFVSVLFCLVVTVGKATAANVDELIKNLQTGDHPTRMKAVEAMVGIDDEKIIDPLMECIYLRGEDWYIKIKAIRILGNIKSPRAVKMLLHVFNDPFLNDECPAIKWNTTIALGRSDHKGTSVVDNLLSALDENNLLLREALIQSLGKIGDAKAVSYIIPKLDEKSFAIKFSAIKALESIGDPQAIPSLKKISDTDADPVIKKEALSAINNIKANGRQGS